jgi:hypothetical protein
MKAEDFEKLIEFRELRFEDKKITSITARLVVQSYAAVTDDLLADVPDSKLRIKRDLVERIMRRLYDDQRDRLSSAIMDFMKCDPLDYQELQDARGALLLAAMRQGPE